MVDCTLIRFQDLNCKIVSATFFLRLPIFANGAKISKPKSRKHFQVAANRTILKIDAFHIAHFEADVPNFPKHLWKLAIPRKLWIPAHSEVSWSGTMTAKMSVFRPLFGRKWFVSPNWPHEPPHGWKATDFLSQMVKRKNYWRNPISRQNFADALAENHNLKLEVCHTWYLSPTPPTAWV